MSENIQFERVDLDRLEAVQRAERPSLHIRWWIPLAAILLCAAQAVLNLVFESRPRSLYLIASQISVIAFAFLAALTLIINPLMRATKLIKPFNRAEVIALFAAVFVSAGISSFGLVDHLLPLIQAPYNPQWNLPQAGWQNNVLPHLNDSLFITDPDAIMEYREGFGSYTGILGRIPWGMWMPPIGLWMIFVAAMYMMFYSISMIFYGNWARREKLIFPLARLPEHMVHDEDTEPGSYSSCVRSGLFWVGFIIVALWTSFNAASIVNWLGELKPLPMGVPQTAIRAMLEGTFLEGIMGDLKFIIIFTAITIGFLLPQDISFSLWVYKLFGLGLFLAAIWTGLGGSVAAFPSDWVRENNFVTGLGAGGLLAFSVSYITKLATDHWRESAGGNSTRFERLGKTLAGFGPGGALALASLLIAAAWLWWAGIPPQWGFFFLAVIVLVTIGLTRVVAEGGVYWFQIHTGPLHLANMLGGARTIPAHVLAPLMPVYYVLFLDIKTFMAPGVMNSFKMQEESRAARKMFHVVVIAGIIATIIAAVFTLLLISYRLGANQSSGWFFTGGPRSFFNHIERFVTEDEGGFSTNWIFYGLGAGWVALSLAMRRRIFWWLHPIGFVMLANPLMSSLWFSFFLGWFFKRSAIKYGGRHTFDKYRPFFIGLLMGELLTIFVWAVIGHVLNLEGLTGIDINRMGI